MPDVNLTIDQRIEFNIGQRSGEQEAQRIGTVAGVQSKIDDTQVAIDNTTGFLTGKPGSSRELLVVLGVAIFAGVPEATLLAASGTQAKRRQVFLQGRKAGLEAGLADLQAAQQDQALGSGQPGDAAVANKPKVDPLGSGFTIR
jgi:hypothetical protein